MTFPKKELIKQTPIMAVSCGWVGYLWIMLLYISNTNDFMKWHVGESDIHQGLCSFAILLSIVYILFHIVKISIASSSGKPLMPTHFLPFIYALLVIVASLHFDDRVEHLHSVNAAKKTRSFLCFDGRPEEFWKTATIRIPSSSHLYDELVLFWDVHYGAGLFGFKDGKQCVRFLHVFDPEPCTFLNNHAYALFSGDIARCFPEFPYDKSIPSEGEILCLDAVIQGYAAFGQRSRREQYDYISRCQTTVSVEDIPEAYAVMNRAYGNIKKQYRTARNVDGIFELRVTGLGTHP